MERNLKDPLAAPPAPIAIFAAVVFVAQLGGAGQRIFSLVEYSTGNDAGSIMLTAFIAAADALSAFVLSYVVLRGFALLIKLAANSPSPTAEMTADERYASLSYILPFMAYGGLQVIIIMAGISADTIKPGEILYSLSLGALMIAAGLACDEYRKVLSRAPAPSAQFANPLRLYRAGFVLTALLAFGLGMETVAWRMAPYSRIQSSVPYSALEAILPVACAYTLIKLARLFCGVLAGLPRPAGPVSQSGSRLRILLVSLTVVASIILLVKVGFLLYGLSSIATQTTRRILWWLMYASAEAIFTGLMITGSAIVVWEIHRLRSHYGLSRKPDPRQRIVHWLAGLLFAVSALWMFGVPAFEILNGRAGVWFWASYGIDRSAYGFMMAALLARELALMNISPPEACVPEAIGQSENFPADIQLKTRQEPT